METTLVTIIERARQSVQAGVPVLNPYPKGTLRHLAYEIGASVHSTGVIKTRSDGQVFAVAELEPGEYQSVVPYDLADMGATHGTIEDAAGYICELAELHGEARTSIAA